MNAKRKRPPKSYPAEKARGARIILDTPKKRWTAVGIVAAGLIAIVAAAIAA